MTRLSDSSLNLALKALKKAFKKDFVRADRTFSPCDLSTVLLIVAVNCLRQEGVRFSQMDKQLSKFDHTDQPSLLSICQEIYDRVAQWCPIEIKGDLPPPTKESVITAKELLSDDILSTLSQSNLPEQVSSISFVYQILAFASRQDALIATQTANKIMAKEDLIAFTQIYTPNWVVDFLVANTVLPCLNLEETKVTQLPERFRQWLPKNINDGLSHRAYKSNFETVTLIDPACGSGQFLLSAFDLLLALYQNRGYALKEAIPLIIGQNLYGADLDNKAIWVATLGLLIRSILGGTNSDITCRNLCLADPQPHQEPSDMLGSLSRKWLTRRDHPLGRLYDVVVTNPPYIGRKSLSRDLKISLKRDYPLCGADLCAAFLKRCLEMLSLGGRLGIITQSSILTLPSHKKMRESLQVNSQIESIVTCGTGVFPLSSGEKIDNVLLVMQAVEERRSMRTQEPRISAHRPVESISSLWTANLVDSRNKAESLKLAINARPSSDKNVNSTLKNQILAVISSAPPLNSIAEVKQGLATTDNKRFVRHYWDVDEEDIGSIWVPYVKGAGSERWHSENNYVVKWANNGKEIKQAVTEAYPYLKGKSGWVVKNEQFYFKPGLCFSFINKTKLAVRRLHQGCIFDVASSAIFTDSENENFLLAYLNSSLLSTIANLINPTINFQVGDVKRLPLIACSLDVKNQLSALADSCYRNKLALTKLATEPTLFDGKLDECDVNRLIGLSLLVNAQVGLSRKAEQLAKIISDDETKIDELVKYSAEKAGLLDGSALKELSLRDLPTLRGSGYGNYQIDVSTFAVNVFYECVRRLMCDQAGEQLFLLPFDNQDVAFAILGLETESANWLENLIGMSLMQYFQRAKLKDLAKPLRQPRRYFSIWLPKSKSVLFLSARALRNCSNGTGKNNNKWAKCQSWLEAALIEQTKLNPLNRQDIQLTGAINEAEALLERIGSKLQDRVDWSGQYLEEALEVALKESMASDH